MQMDYLYLDHVLQWLDTYGHIDFKSPTPPPIPEPRSGAQQPSPLYAPTP